MINLSKKSLISNSTNEGHWTTQSTSAFVHRITFDFARQIEQALESSQQKQAELAAGLGLTEGRVSQTLNNPSSMSLKTIVKYARAIGKKVAVVLYDDRDQANDEGPISSEIFSRCWERSGRPRDFFELETAVTTRNIHVVISTASVPISKWTSPLSHWQQSKQLVTAFFGSVSDS